MFLQCIVCIFPFVEGNLAESSLLQTAVIGKPQCTYSETSRIRHSMGPKNNNVGLGSCWIIECLLPYLCMVTVPHIIVGLERMLDYRGVGLAVHVCS